MSLAALSLSSAVKQIELLYELTEEQPSGTFVGDVVGDARLRQLYSAEDFLQLRFRFLSESAESASFEVDVSRGVLRTRGRVDRDALCGPVALCRVRLDVAVQPVRLFRIIKVSVEVADLNDNRPQFPEPAVSHQLLESALPGNGFSLPSAVDRDGPAYGVQRYELVQPTGTFRLVATAKPDGTTAVRLVLARKLDRETQALYRVVVVAVDGGTPGLTARLDVSVTVLDANDNQPVFVNASYEASVMENARVGSRVTAVRATDADAGLNARVRYAFSPRTVAAHGGVFRIDAATGVVTVAGVVDYEAAAVRHLVVTAQDGGADAVTAETALTVHVKDINDNAPAMRVSTLSSGGHAEVSEDAPVGTFVAHIAVTDADSGRNGVVTCSLERDTPSFTLQSLPAGAEFRLSTARPLDREETARYTLAVRCHDDGEPRLLTVKRIMVIVTDVNDHDPVFSQQSYSVTVAENNMVGATIIIVNATDRDSGRNGDIRYSLVDSDSAKLLRIRTLDGVVTAARSFDREKLEQMEFVVVATDSGEVARSSNVTVTVTITDVNDELPAFSKSGYSFGVYENKAAGTAVGVVTATDADSATYSEVRYSLVEGVAAADFEMDAVTGSLSTRRRLDREAEAVYHLVARASDGGGAGALTSSVSVTVFVADQNDNAPVFAFPSPHNATVAVPGRAPAGYLVARVTATDADIDGNARLSYRLLEGDARVFTVTSRRGEVTLVVAVADVAADRFELTLLVTDGGYPQRSARAVLTVLVNDSLPLQGVPLPPSTPLLAGHNLVVVIAIGSVTFAVAVGLLLAIVLLRRQDASRRDHKYNCRMEALKMLTTRDSPPPPASPQHSDKAPPPNGRLAADTAAKTKKEVSFSLDVEDGAPPPGSHDKSGQSWPSTIDHHNMQVSHCIIIYVFTLLLICHCIILYYLL